MDNQTSSEAFFEAKYREQPDPWDFSHSDYERSRYAAIAAALDRRTYERAFEPGCSIGVLTEELSKFCRKVEAMDIAATAAAQAKSRCRLLPNVAVRQGALPDAMPAGDFDLMVLSEIGYYFDAASWRTLARDLLARLVPGGTLLAAHWLGTSADHQISGDQVHETLCALPDLRLVTRQRHPRFRLDVWARL